MSPVCEICGMGPEDGITVYRNNAKGEKAQWRCAGHLDREANPLVEKLVTTIEAAQAKRRH